MHRKPFMLLATFVLTAVALFAGCGSSSKPAYCTQVTNFENSVNTLEQAEVSPSNVSTIATDVQKVGTSSKELVSAVKTEFAPQINSMKGSVAAMETTLKELVSTPSSSTLSHAVTAIPAQVEALKRSVGEIQDVTKSKCK
jgi:outer membrane murein-binding lipoprotein Lpp